MSVRLFVGNLPFDVTESELKELFAPVGPLSYVFLPVDRETGKRRGFAFVEFADAAMAAEAVRRFNEQPFRGRPLALSEARARESRPAGAPMRPRAPRLPDSFDPPSSMGEGGVRRDRRGREDARRHPKPGSRSSRFEGPIKKGPRREKIGGRVYGLDVDDAVDDSEDLEDSVDEMEG